VILGFEASRLRQGVGIDRYVGGLARTLVRDPRLTRLVLIDPAPGAEDFLPPGRVPVESRRLRMRRRRFGGLLQRRLVADLDLLHFPVTDALAWSGVPQVVTYHGSAPLAFPELHFSSDAERARHESFLRWAFGRAARVVVYSRFALEDTAARFPEFADRLRFAPPGVEPFFLREGGPEDDAVLSRLGLERGFVLFVGGLRKEKGVDRLLAAYASLGGEAPLLVLAGPRPAEAVRDAGLERLSRELGMEGRVRILARLFDDAGLRALYRGASVLVMPSLYESFGFPPLEAMACGTPVIVSAAGALPEVVGEAGIVEKTGTAGGLAEALRAVLRGPGLAAELSRKGRQRALSFTWERALDALIPIYEEVLP